MSDVYIVGIGIHPFGRTEKRSGLDQGAFAVRAALADAHLEWPQIQFAFGGSDAAGKADTLVTQLGLTTLPFINVLNGCDDGVEPPCPAPTARSNPVSSISVSPWDSTSIRAAHSRRAPWTGACRPGTARRA